MQNIFLEKTMCDITACASEDDSCEAESKISTKIHCEIQDKKRDVLAMKNENNIKFENILKHG